MRGSLRTRDATAWVGRVSGRIEDIAVSVRPEKLLRRTAWRRVGARMRVADATAHLPASRAIVLVDDGLATGSTMLAALRALRQQSPARVIVAVPVAAPETCELMEDEADDVVCAATPEPFHAVGLWYEDFEQTSDEEVRELLERAREERRDARAQGAGEVQVDVAAGDRGGLEGDLAVPEGAIGVVLFAHRRGPDPPHPPKPPGGGGPAPPPPGTLR